MTKEKRKCSYLGDTKSEFSWNFTTYANKWDIWEETTKKGSSEILGDELKKFGEGLKKVVRNFARRIENIFEGIQDLVGPGHPTASARRLCPVIECSKPKPIVALTISQFSAHRAFSRPTCVYKLHYVRPLSIGQFLHKSIFRPNKSQIGLCLCELRNKLN